VNLTPTRAVHGVHKLLVVCLHRIDVLQGQSIGRVLVDVALYMPFDNGVFERMKGYSDHDAANFQIVARQHHTVVDLVQFVVDEYAQSLEHFGSRMCGPLQHVASRLVIAHALHQFAKVARRPQRLEQIPSYVDVQHVNVFII